LVRIVREADKPGRAETECWTVQADAAWSATHVDAEAPQVAERLGAALARTLARALGPGVPGVAEVTAHRWRYARVTQGLDVPCLWAGDAGVGAAGDFGAVADVEGAWLSGVALAGRVLGG
jgi:predicted NAD/FAD-dependent oxidoreductase